MRRRVVRLGPILALTGATLLIPAPSAMAHETEHVGPLTVVVGWGTEPTVAGYPNTATLEATKDGAPVEDGTLQVEVLFGDKDSEEKSQPLDMVPSDETPGLYAAFIIPSRSGTYTFHITGTLGESDFDKTFTSSETTFDDVADPQAAQFPAKDPTAGQLTQKIDRLDGRLSSAQTSASQAADAARSAASTARILAIVGVALGAIALVTAFALGQRTRPVRG